MIHVRFEGRSLDFDERYLGLRTGRPMSDGEILERVAHQLDVDPKRFECYIVDRRPGGEIVVRPEAVYG